MDPSSSRRNRLESITEQPGLDFLTSLLPYLLRRLSQSYVFIVSTIEVLIIGFNRIKNYLVRRMFWGRGSLYKSSFHIVITVITSLLLVTGILSRVGLVTEASEQALSISYGTIGNNDLLAQGGSLTTVLPITERRANYSVNSYRVRAGDTLDGISQQFGVSKDTIKWANEDKLSPFNDDVKVGDSLLIPEIDGVLYQVKSGDSLATVVDLTGGNRFDIIELNNLIPPNYRLTAGSRLFIPGGRIATPTPAPPSFFPWSPMCNLPSPEASLALSSVRFVNPLGGGSYIWQRGCSPWHPAVDLSSLGGGLIPIYAAAAGTVTEAGNDWWPRGNYVTIDHGNGVSTHYWHGSNIWVYAGQQVAAGDPIMQMGATGNSTGVHLHLELRHHGNAVDSAAYIPY